MSKAKDKVAFDHETSLRLDAAPVSVDLGHELKRAVLALKAIAALAPDSCCCIGMHDSSNVRCAVTIAVAALAGA